MRPAGTRPAQDGPSRAAGDAVITTDAIVVYGSFDSPWSYLASRRVALLSAAGVEIDWRAVDQEPGRVADAAVSSARLLRLRDEMEKVLEELLPGEQFPYALAGFVPDTDAAVYGYAEAYGAGVADRIRELLFEALWLHSVDLGDAQIVHTLVVDSIRSDSPCSEPGRTWEYRADVAGHPVTTQASRLVERWVSQWHGAGQERLPVVLVDGNDPLVGADAVRWLGTELLNRGLSTRRKSTSEDESPRR